MVIYEGRKIIALTNDVINYGQRCFFSRFNMLTVKEQQFELFIDGRMTAASSRRYFDLINPSVGEVFAQAADAGKEDMLKAVAAARQAFDLGLWPRMSLAERGIYLKKIASSIREHAKELADLESIQCGKTLKQSTFIDIPTAADCFEYFANVGAIHESPLQEKINPVSAPVKSITAFEPIGVVACIIPWNYPLIMAAWKIAPALIAGNIIVFKPSALGCASIMRLAQIIKEAEWPDGVVNIITTTDQEATRLLIEHPEVNMISFTGGTETGQKVMRLASGTTKKISLELGGKSPNIVFADCDLEAAIGGTMSAIFMNQGQMCTAGSRLLLEDKIYEKFLTKLVEKTRSLVIGNALDYQTQFGPIISREHRDHILKATQEAVAEGAKIECGGKIPTGEKFLNGYYIEPTILTNVTNQMKVAQEEIFGPVLCVLKFKDEEEVIQNANDSKFGLASMIWTKDLTKADRVARQLQTGTVWVNTYGGFYNEASFGGFKQSGFGRELGIEGILEYTQSKHICTDKTPGGRSLVTNWF